MKPDLEPILTQTLSITTEERPWGSFTVLMDCAQYKLKLLRVKPGHRLSLQLHQQREEHWLVTQGNPEITVGERCWIAQPGDYIHIPKQTRHRLGNPQAEASLQQNKAEPLQEAAELIELQLGAYFGEDDIVRFEDDYNRV